jgi:hypothetical protein
MIARIGPTLDAAARVHDGFGIHAVGRPRGI